MNELRLFAPCNNVQNVIVVRATDVEGTNWRIDSYMSAVRRFLVIANDAA